MGLFGPSLTEKIRRSASDAFPQANWKVDVDWSSGAKLHQLKGSLGEPRSDAETLQFAKDVWAAVTKQFRLSPDDGEDGLLDVFVSSAGGAVQCTGVAG